MTKSKYPHMQIIRRDWTCWMGSSLSRKSKAQIGRWTIKMGMNKRWLGSRNVPIPSTIICIAVYLSRWIIRPKVFPRASTSNPGKSREIPFARNLRRSKKRLRLNLKMFCRLILIERLKLWMTRNRCRDTTILSSILRILTKFRK